MVSRHAAPLAFASAGVAAVAAVATTSTARRLVPRCPLHSMTGLWCPGCGLTRGVIALVKGHPMAALGYNVFTPFVIALLAAAWAAWMWPTVVPSLARVPKPWWHSLAAVALTFGVLRNLPGPFSALAP